MAKSSTQKQPSFPPPTPASLETTIDQTLQPSTPLPTEARPSLDPRFLSPTPPVPFKYVSPSEVPEPESIPSPVVERSSSVGSPTISNRDARENVTVDLCMTVHSGYVRRCLHTTAAYVGIRPLMSWDGRDACAQSCEDRALDLLHDEKWIRSLMPALRMFQGESGITYPRGALLSVMRLACIQAILDESKDHS